ncbi:uncharacterized protein N7482_010317 [Penicillium canariense]|uniref:Uncharacterized protein n=1 Tax=Penicillium canariense TaxID=189055 RepID=A0A9W9HLL4_9EURO|nr:uncharacterized protein N7482_010317 [Penicillium canariense]KAJ5151065.1 hypothetical protein N7482_010317 [Penicillium canariense]
MVLQHLWHAIRDTVRRDSSEIPTACYNDCNDAAVEVQSSDKTPSICDSNSKFLVGVGTCQKCIEQNSTTTYNDTILPSFEEFLNYCSQIASDQTQSAQIQSLLSQETAAQSALTGLGYSASRTTTYAVPSLTDVPNWVTGYQTGQPSVAGLENYSNVSTIVPAVVVPVVVVGLTVALGFFFLRRRRNRKVDPVATDSSLPPIDKPQLHSDDFRPELDGAEGPKPYAVRTFDLPPLEMPVQEDVRREDVARELEGNAGRGT